MAPNDKPRDKGLGDYAKDFVGGLLGRDDDDDKQSSATQRERAQPNTNEPERPRDKGIGEYTKDFVGGLFGRDDDDQPKTQAAPKKDDNQSFAERVQEDARAAAERAQAQAQAQSQQKQGGAGSIFDRAREAADEAAKRAREAQQSQSPGTSSAPRSSFDKPAQPSASNTDQSELERLRSRVADLERERSAGQAAPSAQQRTYVVKAGDSLSLIAKRIYGDAMQWQRIYDANRSKISNPDLIHPGQEFIIPE